MYAGAAEIAIRRNIPREGAKLAKNNP